MLKPEAQISYRFHSDYAGFNPLRWNDGVATQRDLRILSVDCWEDSSNNCGVLMEYSLLGLKTEGQNQLLWKHNESMIRATNQKLAKLDME